MNGDLVVCYRLRWVRFVDGVASVSRTVDRVLCWYLSPMWCRGRLWTAVCRTTWLDDRKRSR